MKPNELRIGNIIRQSDGTYHTVSKFDDYKVWFEKITNQHGVKCWIVSNIEDVVPIPLTQELLLKCGFEKQASDYEVSHPDYCEWLERKYPVIGVVYQSDAKDCLLAEINGEEVHIHNLHQLQNLFYAITGEELNIEL